ncbi:MAG: D-alanyl-D-alanine carboxypeptidase family protein [Acidimicrobiia bacterium]
MTRRWTVAALAAVLVIVPALPGASAPLTFPVRKADGFPDPGPAPVGALSWILYDTLTDRVLSSHAEDEQRWIASTTKIMTGLLAIELADFEERVLVTQTAADTIGQGLGLVAGEIISLGALVKAALIFSANDAAAAIADHIGGSQEGFVALMNQRAEDLGMTNTHFVNPHGVDQPGHYSTARDLLTLSLTAMGNREFADIVRSRGAVLPDAPDGTRRVVRATNWMLGRYDGTIGIKTGSTPRSGLTFVGSAERDGRRLYAVILGAGGDRGQFAAARSLFDYGFERLGIYSTLIQGLPYRSTMGDPDSSPLLAMARAETLFHLASVGLTLDDPSPLVEVPEPEPPLVIEVERRVERSEQPFIDALTHWLVMLGWR